MGIFLGDHLLGFLHRISDILSLIFNFNSECACTLLIELIQTLSMEHINGISIIGPLQGIALTILGPY